MSAEEYAVAGTRQPAIVQLSPRSPVRLTVANGPCAGDYQTTVETVDRDSICVAVPVLDGQPVVPSPGTAVQLSIPVDQPITRFGAQIMPYQAAQGPVIIINLPPQVKLVQRREDPRFKVAVSLSVVLRGPQAEPKRSRAFPTVTVDLSLGGAAIECFGRYLRPGDKLEIAVLLPGHPAIGPVGGRVRWADGEGRVAGVQFVGLEPRDRALLRSFLVEQARIRRINELTMAIYGVEPAGDGGEPAQPSTLYRLPASRRT